MNYLNTDEALKLFRQKAQSSTYVDKSLLIGEISERINTDKRYVCITRPRRFSKTVNAAMLSAYYTKGYDSRELFKNLMINSNGHCRAHMNTHNVIYIDLGKMPDGCKAYRTYIKSVTEKLKADIHEAYPETKDKLYISINRLLKATGAGFIFILDEWDAVFYKKFMTKSNKNEYLYFLNRLLCDTSYVELSYMTGVVPIESYAGNSQLKMFEEYSIINDEKYSLFFGFNEKEVKNLCSNNSKVLYSDLRKWYSGYSSNDNIFNPKAVQSALMWGECMSYWIELKPLNNITDCLMHNTQTVSEDLVKLVAQAPVKADFKSPCEKEHTKKTREDILLTMVFAGFLSYHDKKVFIPNREAMEKFQRIMSRNSMGEAKRVADKSKEILKATFNMDTKKVAAFLEYIHERKIPYLEYNDENSLACVVTLCYFRARKYYYANREQKNQKGCCDYIFIPKKQGKPAIILEFIINSDGEAALKSLKEKNYISQTKAHADKALLVGIGYETDKDKHTCAIEEYSIK